MKLHIEVMQEDIDEGCKGDGYGTQGGCMVWRAIQRATEGAFTEVLVNYNMASLFRGAPKPGMRFSWNLDDTFRITFPMSVHDRIIDFDAGKPVQPFSFDVELIGR